MKTKNLFLGAAMSLLAVGCATTGTTVTQQIDARNADAATLRTVTILGFSGNLGEQFADRLEASLVEVTLDTGEKYFTVKERKAQQSRSGGGSNYRGTSAEVQAAVDYGKETGVQGVYFGSVSASVDKSNFTATRSVCVEQGFPLCKKSQTRQVPCTKLVANVTATPKLVNVATANTIYGRTIGKSGEYSWCSTEQQLTTENQLLGQAMQAVIVDIKKDVAPWMAEVRVAFKETSKSIRKEDQDAFNGAGAFAKSGRVDRACGIYNGLKEANSTNTDLLYNLGVCAETTQNFVQALQYYTQADSQLTRPDAEINEGLKRARALLAGEEYQSEPDNPLSRLFQVPSN